MHQVKNFGFSVVVTEETGEPTYIHAARNVFREKYKKLGVSFSHNKNGKDLRIHTYGFWDIKDPRKREELTASFINDIHCEAARLKK